MKNYLLLISIILSSCAKNQEPKGIQGKYCFYHSALGYTEILFDDSMSYAYSETEKVLGATPYTLKNDTFYNPNLDRGAQVGGLNTDTLIFNMPLRKDTFYRMEDIIYIYHDVPEGDSEAFSAFIKEFEGRARLFKLQHDIY